MSQNGRAVPFEHAGVPGFAAETWEAVLEYAEGRAREDQAETVAVTATVRRPCPQLNPDVTLGLAVTSAAGAGTPPFPRSQNALRSRSSMRASQVLPRERGEAA